MGDICASIGIDGIEVLENTALLFMRHRSGSEILVLTVLVDLWDLDRIQSSSGRLQIRESRGLQVFLDRHLDHGQDLIGLDRFINHPGPGQVVEHLNGNVLDYRKQNLPNTTLGYGRVFARSGSKSGRLGVRRVGKRWAATFCFQGTIYDF